MDDNSYQNKSTALQQILLRLEQIGQYSAKMLMYVSALGAISVIGGTNIPPEFQILFEGIGINLISSIIDRVAHGESISDEKLRTEIDTILKSKDLEKLLSTNDFFRAVAKILRNQDKLYFAIKDSEFNIIEKLDNTLNYIREHRYLNDDASYPLPPFVAHPYTLSKAHGFFGREKELKKITAWALDPNSSSELSIIAIGGAGKSALAWNWFTQQAPNIAQWEGMIWWSFYKTNAGLDDFITNCLAYLSQKPVLDIVRLSRASREQGLINFLNKLHVLIALDGLERLTLGYSQIAPSKDKPEAQNTFQHFSQLQDERDGRFLIQLKNMSMSRVLITSRVYPKDLRDTLVGRDKVKSYFRLGKMKQDDSLALWHSMGIGGDKDYLLPLFKAIYFNPLLIKVLAGSVKNYRHAPGDFQIWLENNQLTKTNNNLQSAIKHVLEYSFSDIAPQELETLKIISALHIPIQYQTLVELLVGPPLPPFLQFRSFEEEEQLDTALESLEDRGIISWDAINNEYDMHPIVRDFVWLSLSKDEREAITAALAIVFSLQLNVINFYGSQNNLQFIELFYLLVRLEDYAAAWQLFSGGLGTQLIKSEGLSVLSHNSCENLSHNFCENHHR